MANALYKRSISYAALWTLTGNGDFQGMTPTPSQNRIVVYFPAMPETLDLARKTNYLNAVQGPVTPDGAHIYLWTEPLRIPLKFTIAAADKIYTANDGPYALIKIAASLHALVHPIMPAGNANLKKAPSTTINPSTPQENSTNSKGQTVVQPAANSPLGSNTAVGATKYYFNPPACGLSIVIARQSGQSMGVFCAGFVEDVRTVLRGPWLQGDFDPNTDMRNLPSFLDCEFTFVNQPGYTNDLGNTSQAGWNIQTSTALQIYNGFYDVVDVAGGYQAPPSVGITGT